jgi:hypothetical protein
MRALRSAAAVARRAYCRLVGADRGWQATLLGLAIVLAVVSGQGWW